MNDPAVLANVEEIEKMGFPKDQAMTALRLTNNNLQHAVNLLLNGYNEEELMAMQGDIEQEEVGGGGQEMNALDGFLSSGQFDQIRQAVQANPQILPSLLQNIQTQNPEIYQALMQNPQLLQNFISQSGPVLQEEEDDLEEEEGEGIAVTAEDEAAVNRVNFSLNQLVELGFNQNQALEAYLICEKNEMMAANYLFENGFATLI